MTFKGHSAERTISIPFKCTWNICQAIKYSGIIKQVLINDKRSQNMFSDYNKVKINNTLVTGKSSEIFEN
jgi:hypothetical protein